MFTRFLFFLLIINYPLRGESIYSRLNQYISRLSEKEESKIIGISENGVLIENSRNQDFSNSAIPENYLYFELGELGYIYKIEYNKVYSIDSLKINIYNPRSTKVYFIGDDIDLEIEFQVFYKIEHQKIREISAKKFEIPLNYLTPGILQLYAYCKIEDSKIFKDSVKICVIDFEIYEDGVSKYFNPETDSAKTPYILLPEYYANPNTKLEPFYVKFEIVNKKDELIFGPKFLTVKQQKRQTVYWNGKNNYGDPAPPDKGPFSHEIVVRYKPP